MTADDFPPEYRTQWHPERRLAAELGCTAKLLRTVATEAAVEYVRCPDGTVRYRPEDIDTLRAALATEAEDPRTQDARHVQAMFRLTMAAWEKTSNDRELRCKMLESQLDKAYARIAELESRQTEMLEARERLISEAHLRELATKEFAARQEHLNRAFKLVTDELPDIVRQVKDTLGGGKTAAAGRALVDSLRGEQVAVLLALDLVTDEQKSKLRTLWGDRPLPELPGANGKEPS